MNSRRNSCKNPEDNFPTNCIKKIKKLKVIKKAFPPIASKLFSSLLFVMALNFYYSMVKLKSHISYLVILDV